MIAELEALAEIIGPYGIRFMGEKLMDQVSGQVKEIKKLVVLNQDTLLALHTNRDKPEIFNEVMRKVKRNCIIICYINMVHVHVCVNELSWILCRF